MKCPSCGTAVHPAADFCRLCGADAPTPTRETTPRLRGIEALRAILPSRGASEAPRDASRSSTRGDRRVASAPASGSASGGGARVSAPALAMRGASTAAALPRLSSRALVVGAASVIGLLLALVLVRVAFGASEAAQAARELAAAQQAIAQRDAQIASLQGTIATGDQARSDLQSAAKSAEDQGAAVARERDEAKQRVGQLETKLMETQGKLTDAEQKTAQQAQELKSLASCLNGTAVGLAFGRTNRWPSAEFALAAVADACKASEPLLQR